MNTNNSEVKKPLPIKKCTEDYERALCIEYYLSTHVSELKNKTTLENIIWIHGQDLYAEINNKQNMSKIKQALYGSK